MQAATRRMSRHSRIPSRIRTQSGTPGEQTTYIDQGGVGRTLLGTQLANEHGNFKSNYIKIKNTTRLNCWYVLNITEKPEHPGISLPWLLTSTSFQSCGKHVGSVVLQTPAVHVMCDTPDICTRNNTHATVMHLTHFSKYLFLYLIHYFAF